MKRTMLALATASLTLVASSALAAWTVVPLENVTRNSIAYAIDGSGVIAGIAYTTAPKVDGKPTMWCTPALDQTQCATYVSGLNLLYDNSGGSSSGSLGDAGVVHAIGRGVINYDFVSEVLPLAGTTYSASANGPLGSATYWSILNTKVNGRVIPNFTVTGGTEVASEARGVYGYGEIVVGFNHAYLHPGYSGIPDYPVPDQAFSSDTVSSPPSDIRLLPALYMGSRAYGVNSNTDISDTRSPIRRIVGVAGTSAELSHAVMWNLNRKSQWAISDLGTLRKVTQSAAYAVNPWGQIVGESGNVLLGEALGDGDSSNSDSTAVTWNGGAAAALPVGAEIAKSVATAINSWNNGYKGKNPIRVADIVGWGVLATDPAKVVALFWSGEQAGTYPTATQLPSLDSYAECRALGINVEREVVGYCKDTSTDPASFKAVRWQFQQN